MYMKFLGAKVEIIVHVKYKLLPCEIIVAVSGENVSKINVIGNGGDEHKFSDSFVF